MGEFGGGGGARGSVGAPQHNTAQPAVIALGAVVTKRSEDEVQPKLGLFRNPGNLILQRSFPSNPHGCGRLCRTFSVAPNYFPQTFHTRPHS